VEILRDNNLETLRAEREVIVCARAYHSPHLLLLSGLGPADELRALGIEPAGRPVGRAQPPVRSGRRGRVQQIRGDDHL